MAILSRFPSKFSSRSPSFHYTTHQVNLFQVLRPHTICYIPSKFYYPGRESKKSVALTFDSENTFDSPVGKVCYACYYHLRDLQCIHKFLTFDTVAFVANTMVSS